MRSKSNSRTAQVARLLRPLCYPFMAVVELGLLLFCGVLAVISPKAAELFANYATEKLPDEDWYFASWI